MYDYLKNTPEYDYIVATDVTDVIFQRNPIDWMKNNLGDKKIVAGSEALKYKDEPWGNQNLLDTYGNYFYEIFKNNPIYNVGVLGGTGEYMKDLFLNIFLSSINKPVSVVDQSVFNGLIQTQPYKNIIKFADQMSGWACQAGTVADPNVINSFRPNLLENEPIFKNGKVYTSTGEEFTIVHQYDRVPQWKSQIGDSYK